MTAAFIPNLKTWEGRLKQLTENKAIPLSVLQDFLEIERREPIKMAFRLTRFHAKGVKEFWDMFYGSCEQMRHNPTINKLYEGLKNKPVPLIFPSKDATSFNVYPNIIMSFDSVAQLEHCCVYNNRNVLKPLIDIFDAEIVEGNPKKTRWETTSRSWKTLKRKENVTTARVLTRYLGLNDFVKDNVIRDIAAYIDDFRKPVELLYAEDHKHMLDMYTNCPPSCMAVKDGEGRVWQFLIDAGYHPCSFFVYHPYTKGACIKKGNTVVARAILYQIPKTGEWHYGRIFAANTSYQQQFTRLLLDNKITALGHPYKENLEFEIPAIKINDDEYMPWPYFDNFDPHVNVIFADGVFKIKTGDGVQPNVRINTTEGVLRSSFLALRRCAGCGAGDIDNRRQAVSGEFFCSDRCINVSNFVYAFRSDQMAVIVRKDNNIIRDWHLHQMGDRIQYYTNKGAADAMKAFPCIASYGDEISETQISRCGPIIELDGQLVRIIGGIPSFVKVKCIYSDWGEVINVIQNTSKKNHIKVNVVGSVDCNNAALIAA